MVVRNLINSDFYRNLVENYRVVVVSPLYDDIRLHKHMPEIVDFVQLHEHKLSKLERFFVAIHKMLIFNKTTFIKSRYGFQYKSVTGLLEDLKFWSNYVLFGLCLSNIKSLRSLWRHLDEVIFTKDHYEEFFTTYDVDAVFVSNIHYKDEAYFLKSAKRNKVHSIGMTKSWDNFSKDGYRAKVDHLIVWNTFMRDEAVEYQGYKEEDISVVGVPQFDIYTRFSKEKAREKLIETYGLDPRKKIILFGQESKFLSPDDVHVVECLKNWIKSETKPYQIFIRPHFAHKESVEEFAEFVDNKTVFLDHFNNPSSFKDMWDYSVEQDKRLAASMIGSDVIVTSVSTLILDALAAGNEVISYCFDAEKKPFRDSIKRLFEVLWFVELRKYGLDEMTVHSEQELTERIDGVLQNSVKTSEETKSAILDRFCHKVDGKSGKRLYEVVAERV